MSSTDILEHPMRRRMYEAIRDAPGIHLRQLADKHRTAVTNTQWHVRKLEAAGLVRTEKVAGRRLYYSTEGGVASRHEALGNAALQNPNAEAIMTAIRQRPGASQRRIADDLDMNPSTVRWHLLRLQEARLVEAHHDGPRLRYFGRK